MKILIVEDELPAAERLKKILGVIDPTIEILNICDSVESTISWLKKNSQPDVILMDIELSDGRSFEIFNLIRIASKVIFITAYNEFAIKAIKLNALDYLLKPVDKEELEQAIKKIDISINQSEEDTLSDLPGSFSKIAGGEKPKKLVIHDTTGARFIPFDKILRLKADSNYTNIFLNGGETIISSKTLKYYEDLLAGLGFFRVSNTYLVNLAYVEKYKKGNGGDIEMTDGALIEVSRQKKKDLLEALSLNQ